MLARIQKSRSPERTVPPVGAASHAHYPKRQNPKKSREDKGDKRIKKANQTAKKNPKGKACETGSLHPLIVHHRTFPSCWPGMHKPEHSHVRRDA